MHRNTNALFLSIFLALLCCSVAVSAADERLDRLPEKYRNWIETMERPFETIAHLHKPVIAQLHGFIDSKVDIKLPGGILAVEWDGVGEVLLSGPAEVVFTGEWLSEV